MSSANTSSAVIALVLASAFGASTAHGAESYYAIAGTLGYANFQGWDSNGQIIADPFIQDIAITQGGSGSASASIYLDDYTNKFWAEAQAAASISAGALKAYAGTNIMDAGSTEVVNADAYARIMDSFRFATPTGPFSFGVGDTVTFNIAIDGYSSLTEAYPWSGGDIGLYVSFAWYAPGTLAANGLNAGGQVNGTSLGTCIFGASESNVTQLQFGNIACSGLSDFDEDLADGGSLGGPFDDELTVTFNPMGDFDWSAQLLVNSRTNLVDKFAYINAFDTAELSFQGPSGATTYSGSGLFPNTLPVSQIPQGGGGSNAVPEPGTLVLLVVGLVATAWRRRQGLRTYMA